MLCGRFLRLSISTGIRQILPIFLADADFHTLFPTGVTIHNPLSPGPAHQAAWMSTSQRKGGYTKKKGKNRHNNKQGSSAGGKKQRSELGMAIREEVKQKYDYRQEFQTEKISR